ncbi:MAG: hypothetical protein CMD26_03850 [Flavobacteriales bacterium]|nr:hypothetical protein [Flavobacteriales bacterium]|tara:strand:- start:783 stop:3866 length:3084 start_codon:yes stop_codon:yes gene_type:complete
MSYLYIVCFSIVLVFSVSPVDAQESISALKEDVFDLMKDNSSRSNKKKVRKFFRILNSKNLPSNTNSIVKFLLIDFNERKLGFHNYYLSFFDFLIECDDKKEYQLLNSVLNYFDSNLNTLSNIELKHFLARLNNFVKFNMLIDKENFTWSAFGSYSFMISSDQRPVFNFDKVQVSLANKFDTVVFFNLTGQYELLKNSLEVEYAESDFYSEDVSVDFLFNNFSIDLNKNFFQIKNATIRSQGVVSVICNGVFKNKLTSSNNYPVFNSNSESISFKIFDNIDVVSGFELRGENIFLNRNGNPIHLLIKDDNNNYKVTSKHFQISNNSLSSSDSRFVISNQLDSIYHPVVKFSYNDFSQKILIDRISGQRGLNPIRNSFHGLNMFADRLEIDLVYDNCLLFHYAPGTDIEVLFESDNYFDKSRYNDFFSFDVNVFGLLFGFLSEINDSVEEIDYSQIYFVKDFCDFNNLDFSTAISYLINFEIFGFLDYNRFDKNFKIKPWALNFIDAVDAQYDYDVLKIEALAGIGDTIAEIDLLLNTMDVFRVNKINITDRFDFDIYPMSNKISFFDNKSFSMDGNIYIGDFAFSGKDVRFNYDDFAFQFNKNSIFSFIDPSGEELSSSLIHFDYGFLFIDSVTNKSGLAMLNDFPRFQTYSHSFLSYNNDPVQFLIDPISINYLSDMSLDNLAFSGSLHIDGDSIEANGVLKFNKAHNLETVIMCDSIDIYKNKITLEQGSLSLNQDGLFASGNFTSNDLYFYSNSIELLSGQLIGNVRNIMNGPKLDSVPFKAKLAGLHYTPYDNNFLIKSNNSTINLYQDYNFKGDLYFDGNDLNGGGSLNTNLYKIESSHIFFTHDNIMSADAVFTVVSNDKKGLLLFKSSGASVEYSLDNKSILINKSVENFSLPHLSYFIDFESVLFDLKKYEINFLNYDPFSSGRLYTSKYGKTPFEYHALNATYSLGDNKLCVSDGIQLDIKRYWLQPSDNQFCVLDNGDFSVFENASLIKKRFLRKDKLISDKDVFLTNKLKADFIND